MKNLIKNTISNKLYMGCLLVVFLFYTFQIEHVTKSLFKTTIELTIFQYGLAFLSILGISMLAGTILFGVLNIYKFMFKKWVLPVLKKVFK